MRECTRCHRTQPLAAFKPHPRGREGRETVCRTCRQDRQRAQRQAARAQRQAPPAEPAAPALAPLLSHEEAAVIADHYAHTGCQNCGPQRITYLGAYKAEPWHTAGEVVPLALAGYGAMGARSQLRRAVILCGNCVSAALADPALLALDRDQAATPAPAAGGGIAAL